MKPIKPAILLLLLCNLGGAAADKATPITLPEAEILIYLMPAARELRKQGFDVGWDVERSSDPDQFQFHVFNRKRKCPEGCSVTVGYFSVNRRTAEVMSIDSGTRVIGKELSGVQRILRRGHHLEAGK